MATVPEEIQAMVEKLPPDKQLRVLEYVRSLAQSPGIDLSSLPRSVPPPGTPANALPHFDLSDEDAEAMERAIKDCYFLIMTSGLPRQQSSTVLPWPLAIVTLCGLPDSLWNNGNLTGA